jgi:hypothetical protein
MFGHGILEATVSERADTVLCSASTRWMKMRFPLAYREAMPVRDELTVSRVLTADGTPFGVFSFEESEIDGAAYTAMGPAGWVAAVGDDLRARLQRFQPVFATDTRAVSGGLGVRDLDGRVSVGGTALVRAKVRTRFSQVRGRGCVALAWSIATIGQAAVVDDFIESVRWLADPPRG